MANVITYVILLNFWVQRIITISLCLTPCGGHVTQLFSHYELIQGRSRTISYLKIFLNVQRVIMPDRYSNCFHCSWEWRLGDERASQFFIFICLRLSVHFFNTSIFYYPGTPYFQHYFTKVRPLIALNHRAGVEGCLFFNCCSGFGFYSGSDDGRREVVIASGYFFMWRVWLITIATRYRSHYCTAYAGKYAAIHRCMCGIYAWSRKGGRRRNAKCGLVMQAFWGRDEG